MVEIHNLEDHLVINLITICHQDFKNASITVFILFGTIAMETSKNIRVGFLTFLYQSVCIKQMQNG
jgi:hypothetical protein